MVADGVVVQFQGVHLQVGPLGRADVNALRDGGRRLREDLAVAHGRSCSLTSAIGEVELIPDKLCVREVRNSER